VERELHRQHGAEAAPGVLPLREALEVGLAEAGEERGGHEAHDAGAEPDGAQRGGAQGARDQDRDEHAERAPAPRAERQEQGLAAQIVRWHPSNSIAPTGATLIDFPATCLLVCHVFARREAIARGRHSGVCALQSTTIGGIDVRVAALSCVVVVKA